MISIDRFSRFSLFVLFISTLSGIAFGYHLAILSGLLNEIGNKFHLSVFDQGFLVSMLLFGGTVGALFAGLLVDRWGRRPTLWLTTLIFMIGPLIFFLSSKYSLFLIARFVTGLSLGITSVATPLYLAEISPPHYRGRYVSLFQIAITLGILFAYATNLFFAEGDGWRIAFLWSLLPPLIQCFGMPLIPESPSWLFSQGKENLAKKALLRLRGDQDWRKHVNEMKMTGHREDGKLKWSKHLVLIIFLGVVLSIFQQITGINTIVYYAPTILNQAGLSSNQAALMATFVMGIANTCVTLIAIWLIDQTGRRVLLLTGVLGMAICLGMLTLILQMKGDHLLAVISIIAYVSFFSFSLGPITWVILSEIFPLKIRGLAMGLAIFVNWVANYCVSLTFLPLIQRIGIDMTFAIYAVISFICFFFVLSYIPETKGKSLEELEKMLQHKKL